MRLFKQLARVTRARQRVARHRGDMAVPAAALLERGQRHPLTALGVVAGAGFLLGSLGVNPLRVPGLLTAVGTALTQIVAYGARLVAELGMGAGDSLADSEGT